MKITFNVLNCGLENNGGSDTIIKSANTLVDLGHEVILLGNQDIRYTWEPIKAEHIKVKGIKDKKELPSADVVISTGFATVRKMLHFPDRCGKRFWWIRGWETWNYPEAYIRNTLLQYPVTKIVNGIQLQEKLEKLGVKSHLVRPGYDFNAFSCLNIRGKNEQIILGGLYSNGKKRKAKRTDWIFKAVERLKQDHDIKLWMFGVGKLKHDGIDRYFREPSPNLKNLIYNQCDIWLAPTELEGLHMPPAEAMLTECPVIGTNAELSGMSDYMGFIWGETVAENNIDAFIDKIEDLIKFPKIRSLVGILSRKNVLRLGDRKTNMQKMVEVLNG